MNAVFWVVIGLVTLGACGGCGGRLSVESDGERVWLELDVARAELGEE
jgi:hypothetical protein